MSHRPRHHHHHPQQREGGGGYGGNGAGGYPPQQPFHGSEPSPYLPQQQGHGYPPAAGAYGQSYQQTGEYGYGSPSSARQEQVRLQEPNCIREQERRHKKQERMAELGAIAAGAFAMYEAHEVKADPEHARRHKIEEDIAGAVAVGAGGYAVYEHHQVRKDERAEHKYGGKKRHHWF